MIILTYHLELIFSTTYRIVWSAVCWYVIRFSSDLSASCTPLLELSNGKLAVDYYSFSTLIYSLFYLYKTTLIPAHPDAVNTMHENTMYVFILSKRYKTQNGGRVNEIDHNSYYLYTENGNIIEINPKKFAPTLWTLIIIYTYTNQRTYKLRISRQNIVVLYAGPFVWNSRNKNMSCVRSI